MQKIYTAHSQGPGRCSRFRWNTLKPQKFKTCAALQSQASCARLVAFQLPRSHQLKVCSARQVQIRGACSPELCWGQFRMQAARHPDPGPTRTVLQTSIEQYFATQACVGTAAAMMTVSLCSKEVMFISAKTARIAHQPRGEIGMQRRYCRSPE